MKIAALKHYRAQLEEACRVELADIEHRLHVATEGLHRLEVEAEAEAQQFMADVRGGLTTNEVEGRHVALNALTEAIQQARLVVQEARRMRDEKLSEVVEASREKKKLDILAQREALRLRRRQERREQGEFDEVAGRRFIAGRDH
ncbi:MAG: flagellar export protein FliJ [Nitrospirae bacterium]|nr:MAG: flagellar export protein FliJ [Nitrospirota bacterium]